MNQKTESHMVKSAVSANHSYQQTEKWPPLNKTLDLASEAKYPAILVNSRFRTYK